MRWLMAAALVLFASGCIHVDMSRQEQEQPDSPFVASFGTVPQPVYEGDGLTITATITNAGTSPASGPACMLENGVASYCDTLTLAPQQQKRIHLNWVAAPPGQTFSALGASIHVPVVKHPTVGDWIRGPLVDLQLASANYTQESGRWVSNVTFRAEFHVSSDNVSLWLDNDLTMSYWAPSDFVGRDFITLVSNELSQHRALLLACGPAMEDGSCRDGDPNALTFAYADRRYRWLDPAAPAPGYTTTGSPNGSRGWTD